MRGDIVCISMHLWASDGAGWLNGSIRAGIVLTLESHMVNINIDGLKDDESWRRLTAMLLDAEVSDESLQKIRVRLMARLSYVSEKCGAD